MLTKDINVIIDSINNGEVVAIPTDGVFGLFCKKDCKEAIEKIYELKNRNLNKKLCIYTKDLNFLTSSQGIIGMTYIYKGIGYRSSQIHPSLEKIISKTGDLLGTSCNLSEEIPITHFKHINFDIPILQEPCLFGLESTVFSLDDRKILRQGLVLIDNIEVLNKNFDYKTEINNNVPFPDYSCKELSKNFWFLLKEYKSLNFNIDCFCHTCNLIKSYIEYFKKSSKINHLKDENLEALKVDKKVKKTKNR